MVTYPDLRDARLNQLASASDAWQRLVMLCEALEQDSVGDLTGPLRASGWAGAAADAALRHLTELDDEFEVAVLRSRTTAAVLRRAVEDFTALQQRLRAAAAGAAAAGLTVDNDGRVSPPEMGWADQHGPDGELIHQRHFQNAAIYADLFSTILAEATDADNCIARALMDLRDAAPGQNEWEYNKASEGAQTAAATFGLSESNIPAADTDPAAVKAWWAGLSADERQICLTAYPQHIGVLDGVPAADRDEANRLALRNYIGDNVNHHRDQGNTQHDRALMLLDRLETAEQGPDNKRLLLLTIDPTGDGRAAVAVGNPDSADHIAVLIPGVGTELDDIRGLIDRSSDIQDAAVSLRPDDQVVVVGWLGYDTPSLDEDVVSAVSGGKSRAGGEALDGFVNGLHTTHDGPARITAIGHSYGSTVLGEAASTGDGLAVNDVVAVGSPGMRVDNASEFNVPTDHVWAGAAADDNFVARPENTAQKIPLIGNWIGGVANEGIHGPGPHYPEFGGNVLSVDTHGHSGYWAPGSTSLRSQAAIVVGDYQNAPITSGEAPS